MARKRESKLKGYSVRFKPASRHLVILKAINEDVAIRKALKAYRKTVTPEIASVQKTSYFDMKFGFNQLNKNRR